MRGLIVLSLLLSGFVYSQNESNVKDNWTWLSSNIGYGGKPNYSQLIFSLSATQTFGVHAFDIKYRNLKEIEPRSNEVHLFSAPQPTLDPDVGRTFNLQYGVSLTQEHLRFNAGLGIGYMFGKKEVVLGPQDIESQDPNYSYYNNKGEKVGLRTFNTVNVPIDLDVEFLLGTNIGIEINGFIDMNFQMLSYGGTIGLILGRLR